MRGSEKRGVASAPVGAEEDVKSVALDITSSEINAIAMSDEPLSLRRERLQDMVKEIEARIDASERGKDLAPLLEEAREALRIIHQQQDPAG